MSRPHWLLWHSHCTLCPLNSKAMSLHSPALSFFSLLLTELVTRFANFVFSVSLKRTHQLKRSIRKHIGRCSLIGPEKQLCFWKAPLGAHNCTALFWFFKYSLFWFFKYRWQILVSCNTFTLQTFYKSLEAHTKKYGAHNLINQLIHEYGNVQLPTPKPASIDSYHHSFEQCLIQ